MEQQIPCLNHRVKNCGGIISARGNVYCDDCTQEQQKVLQSRREFSAIELIEKNRLLEEEISKFRLQIALLQNETPSIVGYTEEQFRELVSTEEKRQQMFTVQLQQEIEKLTGDLSREKTVNQQLTIDFEKLASENKRLFSLSKTLLDENKALAQENAKLASLNENLVSLTETQIQSKSDAKKKSQTSSKTLKQ